MQPARRRRRPRADKLDDRCRRLVVSRASSRTDAFPWRTRAALALAESRRRIRAGDRYRLGYAGGSLFLSQDDYEIDWETLKNTLVDEPYLADYRGAIVLDLGAHKGYYGAYALAHGAASVASYEPEAANVSFLARSAATFSRGVALARRQGGGQRRRR